MIDKIKQNEFTQIKQNKKLIETQKTNKISKTDKTEISKEAYAKRHAISLIKSLISDIDELEKTFINTKSEKRQKAESLLPANMKIKDYIELNGRE